MTGPTVGVLVRSYRKDFGWLRYCLAALNKFLVDVEVTVVVPKASKPWLPRLGPLAPSVTVRLCDGGGDDYLGQQLTKMFAERYVAADVICHVDSDCILSAPTQARDLLPGGRPVVAVRPLSRYQRRPQWIEPAERYLGWSLELDYMCRPPFVFPRWLYPLVREHGERHTDMDTMRYVMSRAPRGFSEFTSLGAYAYRHCQQAFEWVDADTDRARSPFRWYWSWGGISPALQTELEDLVRQ